MIALHDIHGMMGENSMKKFVISLTILSAALAVTACKAAEKEAAPEATEAPAEAMPEPAAEAAPATPEGDMAAPAGEAADDEAEKAAEGLDGTGNPIRPATTE